MHEIVPVILAAGRGSRLGLADLPKPMAVVAGRPLMQTAVESLFQSDFSSSEINAVIGYRGEVIKNYFCNDLFYCYQNQLNGNAGAVEAFLSSVKVRGDKNLLVIQGDDADQASTDNLSQLIHFHLSRRAEISLLTVNRPDLDAHQFEYMCAEGDRVTEMVPLISVDSHGRYNAGVYIFSTAIFEETLTKLKAVTPDGGDLGLGMVVKLAIETNCRVFQFCSPREYIAVNTSVGLQRLRNRGDC